MREHLYVCRKFTCFAECTPLRRASWAFDPKVERVTDRRKTKDRRLHRAGCAQPWATDQGEK